MAKIFLDAGHNYSGGDTGAQGNGLLEQNITWEFTSRIAKLFRAAGQVVIESRPLLTTNIGTNLTDSINGRIAMANNSDADILICVHANAADPTANGTEVWICSTGGNSEKLAKAIISPLVSAISTFNRGVKVNPTAYGVLRDTKMPAVLVETAFITNVSDAKKLVQYDVIAKAIYTGAMNYLEIAIPVPTPAPAPVSAPQPTHTSNIQVGSKVKMTGSKYATGQTIPLWSKLRVYDVLRVNNDEILVGIGKAVTGWIWKSECKLV